MEFNIHLNSCLVRGLWKLTDSKRESILASKGFSRPILELEPAVIYILRPHLGPQAGRFYSDHRFKRETVWQECTALGLQGQ